MNGALKMVGIKLRLCAALLAFPLMTVGAASFADTLPKNAVPLSSAEVSAIYSGKSIIWRGGKNGAYLASSGKAIGVYTDWHDDIKPNEKWTGYWAGTWSTRGNQMCIRYSGYDLVDKKPFPADMMCWKWYRAGSAYYTIQSKMERGKRPSGPNDYYTKEATKLRSGDRISTWFNQYKSKAKGQ